jgi:flagellar FliJ protein
MKFKFSLEKLLEHRRAVENQAKRDWADAQAAVDVCKRHIEEMFGAIEQSRHDRFRRESSGGGPGLEHFDLFTRGQMLRIEAAKQQLRVLMTEADARLEVMTERAKERKALEKLRERRLSEHREMAKIREIKRVDDLVTMRAGRKAIHEP